MKKALPLTLVLIGAALLITAVVFWIDTSTSTQPDSFGKSLRDWITLILGVGASIKGWMDLLKKEPPASSTQSNSDGGIIVNGKIESVGKDVIGRDQVITTNIVTEDDRYNVEGLFNPYLGLRAFTYNDRDKYAGREKLTEEALLVLVSPELQQKMLFVTGASGSGKSSFVQASLLPAIINHFPQEGEQVKFEVFRPSRNPKTRLDEAIKRTSSDGIRVIVIDQFEELFTQSSPNERNLLYEFLKNFRPFDENHLIVIATLRSDYLGELFDVKWLWEIAKQGVEVREMRIQELKEAIVRPLQFGYPSGEKRFEGKLVEKLAQDTVGSVAYLPLLQVTLEEIWNKGQLKLSAYSTLSDAIKERADIVLTYHDFDMAYPKDKRSDAEKEVLLNLLLDLVTPSLEADVRHDARVARILADYDKNKIGLFRELSSARLVSIEIEEGIEIVNLIHETLIRNWGVLNTAIQEKRVHLQKRVRFEDQLKNWLDSGKSDDYLLSKGHLIDAVKLDVENDIALSSEIAQDFLIRSNAQVEEISSKEKEVANLMQKSELSLLLSSTLDLDTILYQFIRYIYNVFQYDHISVYLYDDDVSSLILKDAIGILSKEMKKTGYRIPVESNSAVSVAYRYADVIIIDNIDFEKSYEANPFLLGTISELVCPIMIRGHVVGVIDIHSYSVVDFASENKLEKLVAFVDQLALPLDGSRLYRESLQRAALESLFSDIVTRLSLCKSLTDLLKLTVDELSEALNVCVIFFLANEKREYLEIRALARCNDELLPSRFITDVESTDLVFKYNGSIPISEPINEFSKDFHWIANGVEVKPQMSHPVHYYGEDIGVICVLSDKDRNFTDQERQLFMRCCEGVSAFVEKFKL